MVQPLAHNPCTQVCPCEPWAVRTAELEAAVAQTPAHLQRGLAHAHSGVALLRCRWRGRDFLGHHGVLVVGIHRAEVQAAGRPRG